MTTNDDDWAPRAATWDEIETGFHEYAADLTKRELEWPWGQTSFPPEFADWKVGMAAARKWLAAHDARVRRDAAREALDGLVAHADTLAAHAGTDAARSIWQTVAGFAEGSRDTHYPETED